MVNNTNVVCKANYMTAFVKKLSRFNVLYLKSTACFS